jgi:putative nucleotidyltransferase with HDIG domain
VDLVQEDNSLMLGLATIRDYDDYTYTHSVNVALLATCLGRHVGLSKVTLEYLTVCALFHDLGKVEVSKDILLKPGQLNADEWDKMRKHPLIGVRKILRLQAPHSLKSRIILGPFEHHLNPDLSGYPYTYFMKKLSLLGKILRIVDVYEALTSERIYRPRSFSPDEALRRMWSERGKNFDTPLLKSFISMMGIYPIGTIVELDSGEIGLVMDYTDESEKALPLVMLLVEDGEGVLTRGETVNLAAQGTNTDSPRRNIARGIPSSRLGIEPSQFLL